MRTFIALIGSLILCVPAAAAPPPRIASVEPARVPKAGGARVVIAGAGEGFMPGLTVRLCGTVLEDATWVTANQVEFVAPPRDAGACAPRASQGSRSSVNPAGTREALVRAIEEHLGSDVIIDLARPLRPLP